MKKIVIENIPSRSYKRRGVVYEGKPEIGRHAEIIPGASIRLYGERYGNAYERTFKIGDEAEYDSYNLSYTGSIVSIGAKRVVIQDKHGERKSLDIHQFNWRNYDFDAEETFKNNSETMMVI